MMLVRAMKSQVCYGQPCSVHCHRRRPRNLHREQDGSVGDNTGAEAHQEALGLHHVLAEVLGPTEEATAQTAAVLH